MIPPSVSAQDSGAKEFQDCLETCRQFLLAIANAELPDDLRAKCGASDLVQDSLLEAHRDRHHFRGRTVAELRAWLRGILAHKLAGTRRRYRGTAARDVTREQAVDEADLANTVTPPEVLIRRESDELVAAALSRLTAVSRWTIALRLENGHSFAEIGALLGRTEEAARKLFTRAVTELRELTRPLQEDPCPIPG